MVPQPPRPRIIVADVPGMITVPHADLQPLKDNYRSNAAGLRADEVERAKRRAMFPPSRKGTRAFLASEARRGR